MQNYFSNHVNIILSTGWTCWGAGAGHSVEQQEGGSTIIRTLEEQLEGTKAWNGPQWDGSLYIRFACALLSPKNMQKSESLPCKSQEMHASDVGIPSQQGVL